MTITNSTIVTLITMLLIFLFLLLVVSVIKSTRKHHPKHEPQSTPQPKQLKTHRKERHEEVVDTLDWMLQNQIINTTEYNQLMVKSLPYLN